MLKKQMEKRNRQNSQMNNSRDLMAFGNDSKKFEKSRHQCLQELENVLRELNDSKAQLKKQSEESTFSSIAKFERSYDQLSGRIIKSVQDQLENDKKRILNELKSKVTVETGEERTIRSNIAELSEQANNLLGGLKVDTQYRQYIAKVVQCDFDQKVKDVKEDIKRVRYPPVHLSINDKYYSCLKNDAGKIIIIDNDVVSSRSNGYTGTSRWNQGVNLHQNRDFMKKNGDGSNMR